MDDTTGQISGGGDGIPEITFELAFQPPPNRLPGGIGPPQAWLIRQDTGRFDAMQFAQQALGGLTTDDLDFCGGELNRLSTTSRSFAIHDGLDRASLRALGNALLAIRGKKRIWPLAASRSTTQIILREFAAAQLVDVRLNDDESGLIIVVQPCLIVTPTAMVERFESWNPWIGKLMITG